MTKQEKGAALTTKISVRMPGMEVEFEGSEDFVRDELRGFVEEMASLQVEDQNGQEVWDESDRKIGLEPSGAKEKKDRQDEPTVAVAQTIGVEPADIKSAFSPDEDPPYVQVDKYYWNAFKKNTPGGGRNAISSGALVGTLLCLWFEEIGRGEPTKTEIVEATDAAAIKDTRIDRSMKNCDWLRVSGEQVNISPAQLGEALNVARAFCLKEPVEEAE